MVVGGAVGIRGGNLHLLGNFWIEFSELKKLTKLPCHILLISNRAQSFMKKFYDNQGGRFI
jgi:hypothetical protein